MIDVNIPIYKSVKIISKSLWIFIYVWCFRLNVTLTKKKLITLTKTIMITMIDFLLHVDFFFGNWHFLFLKEVKFIFLTRNLYSTNVPMCMIFGCSEFAVRNACSKIVNYTWCSHSSIVICQNIIDLINIQIHFTIFKKKDIQ